MSEQPTPETDALDHELHSPCVLQDRYSEMRDHARKLERERDEAREALRTLAEHGESEIQRVTKERDEAREELVWVTRLVETIRDKAEIRYGRNTGFMAFSDLKDEARRSMRLEAAK